MKFNTKMYVAIFILLISVFEIRTALLFSQEMKIQKKDRTVIIIPLSDIDKITYTGAASTTAVNSSAISTPSIPESPVSTVIDIDGNVYKTIRIGQQTWMAEDLRVTKFNNGTPISIVSDSKLWSSIDIPAYSWYDNITPDVASKYGALYNGYVVESSSKVCPNGWRIPTKDDWDSLIKFYGGAEIAGGKLKEAGISNWYKPNSGAETENVFMALPVGYRNSTGSFSFRGGTGLWWTSTVTSYSNFATMAMYYNYSSVVTGNFPKAQGVCIRCMKDGY